MVSGLDGLLGTLSILCPQVDLEPPPRMVATEAELLKGVLTGHLVRMLRVAPHLQMLDFTTFAIQVLLMASSANPALICM